MESDRKLLATLCMSDLEETSEESEEGRKGYAIDRIITDDESLDPSVSGTFSLGWGEWGDLQFPRIGMLCQTF